MANITSSSSLSNYRLTQAQLGSSATVDSTAGLELSKTLRVALNQLLSYWEKMWEQIPTPTQKRNIQQLNSFNATFDLTALKGSNGFRIEGLFSGDSLGGSVNSAGDVNGDGFADIVIGCPNASPGGLSEAGKVYVIFGQANGWLETFDLANLNGTNGFKIEGFAAGDWLGDSVGTAYDLNGDGLDELLITAPRASPGGRLQAGAVYILFGKSKGWPAAFNLLTLNGSNGFKVEGLVASDRLGSVSAAGDINGDGKSDLVFGATNASPARLLSAGIAYVLLGQTSTWPATFNLNSLNGANGFKIDGLNIMDGLGSSVSIAGDINGDGFSDLVLGAESAKRGLSFGGVAYILFGRASSWPATFDLETLDGTSGFRVEGLYPYGFLGDSVSSAGDLNNDGIDDLLIGSYYASPENRTHTGIVYVLFGRASGWNASFNLTSLNGSNGFLVEGLNAEDNLGTVAEYTGDLNGDGITDLILGAPGYNPDNRFTGIAYVLFGHNATWPKAVDLSSLDGYNGFSIEGFKSNMILGDSLNTAGDFNGDGISDLVIGAPHTSPEKRSVAGTTYVIFGTNIFAPIASSTPSQSSIPLTKTPSSIHSPSTLESNAVRFSFGTILGITVASKIAWNIH